MTISAAVPHFGNWKFHSKSKTANEKPGEIDRTSVVVGRFSRTLACLPFPFAKRCLASPSRQHRPQLPLVAAVAAAHATWGRQAGYQAAIDWRHVFWFPMCEQCTRCCHKKDWSIQCVCRWRHVAATQTTPTQTKRAAFPFPLAAVLHRTFCQYLLKTSFL